MANVWDRQRNEDGELEPIKWYSRFETYRLLGANRSLLATYNADRRDRAREGSTSTPRSWTKNAEAWHWQERAELWDETILQEARQADADRERNGRPESATWLTSCWIGRWTCSSFHWQR